MQFCFIKKYSGYEHINVCSDDESSIRDLANVITDVVGYEAKIVWSKKR